jgi:hypothetical protein
MGDVPDILKDFYSEHDRYSIRTSWHQQHVIENVLDLRGFIASISGNLETEQQNAYSYPLGYFQVEQPSRIRYTHLIFLFAILERRVRALVKLTIELRPDVKTDLSNYKGSFFERVKRFFGEHLELDLSTIKQWQEIILYQKLRDCIIHCGGRVTESRDEDFLRHLVADNKIALNKGDYMLVPVGLCDAMEDCIIEFLSSGLGSLYQMLSDRNDK